MRKGTLMVPFHAILPSETFGRKIIRQSENPGAVRTGVFLRFRGDYAFPFPDLPVRCETEIFHLSGFCSLA